MLQISTHSLDALVAEGRRRHAAGQVADAEAYYRQALLINPRHGVVLCQLGKLTLESGRYAAGLEILAEGVKHEPEDAEMLAAHGSALAHGGRVGEALAQYEKAIAKSPALLNQLAKLGIELESRQLWDAAIAVYHCVLKYCPGNTEVLTNLGVLLQFAGDADQSLDMFRQCIRYGPNNAALHSNLGGALLACGFMDEALLSLRRAVSLDAALIPAASSLLLTLQYHPDIDGRAIGNESRRWNDTVVRSLVKPFTTYHNDRTPNRRLRIGYVSPDLTGHPVGRFMAPLLLHHDASAFDVFCYSLNVHSDPITEQLRALCGTWRDVAHCSDGELAALIWNDRVDILVDLAMHGHGGRPLVFAQKPAPVQVAYLAYAGTTGLDAMDYRLSDPYIDPPGTDESDFSEKTFRLRQSFWCFHAPTDIPSPSALPAVQNNYITFGCLNDFKKVNDRVLDTWGRLLGTPIAGLGPSRLILFCPPGDHRRRTMSILTRYGAPEESIEFVSRAPFPEYIERYRRIDIGLDPFPYCGGTTTCDALWMGVPVVTFRGNKSVARSGASILSNCAPDGGLADLIGNTPGEYIRIATTLAGDLTRLGNVRKTLRSLMESSPLMDAPARTRDLESAYRQMWQTWCASVAAR